MFSHVSVHPSFCLSTGGYPRQVHLRYPHYQTRPEVGTLPGWYPKLGTRPLDLARGVPHLGYPHQTWPGGPCLGVPHLRYPSTPIRPGQWGTLPGVPHLGYPPIRPGQWYPAGGTPPRVTDRVLDTPRSVCLLRSRRRTFLFIFQVKV